MSISAALRLPKQAIPRAPEGPTHADRYPDAEWFATVYEQNIDRIHAHIRVRVASVELAEDLTAQTFLRAWTARERYKPVPGRPILAWLFTIANNLVIDFYRRSRREYVGVKGDVRDAGAFDPEQRAVDGSVRHEILCALRRLKPDQQLAVSLRLLDGLEYSEIAQLTGKTQGALRVLVCRGLALMRDDLSARGLTPT